MNILFLLVAIPGFAETPVGLSIKAGLRNAGWFPTTDGRDRAVDSSSLWVIAPAIEFRPHDVARVELSAIYQALRSSQSGGIPGFTFSTRTRGRGWEFPILAKLRVLPKLGAARPFVLAGPSIHYSALTTDSDYSGRTFRITEVRVRAGLSLGGGIEWYFGRLRAGFDARWAWWPKDEATFGGAPNRGPHQAIFVAGFGF